MIGAPLSSPEPSRSVPGLLEQLQQIAHLDASVWAIGANQNVYHARRKVTNSALVLRVMRDLGSHQVKSIDIETALGLSRGGCLKRLRKMVLEGLVIKHSNCCRNTTWSIGQDRDGDGEPQANER